MSCFTQWQKPTDFMSRPDVLYAVHASMIGVRLTHLESDFGMICTVAIICFDFWGLE